MPKPKNPDPKFNAITSMNNKCKYFVKNASDKYCDAHKYMNEYSEEMLKKLHKCSKCPLMIKTESERCLKCNYGKECNNGKEKTCQKSIVSS